ncbi:MAG TPA: polysaccharide deacetylase family protein [Gemmatimonadales bacterium]|jgi:peptidoglycan/xylan/chitin deacetylase (PgdA/CDA1 family)
MMRAILTYHSIDGSGSPISVTPEAFRAHVEWLATGTVMVVSLTELLALADEVDAVALTFDDALVSVATAAAPLLAAHAFPATVFAVTRHAGGDNRWNGRADRGIPAQAVLGWDAVARLRRQGFAIGAHTRHHRHLRDCSRDELTDELAGSAEDIATTLGERPTTLAYPYGDVDARVARAAGEQFAICCTTEFRPVRATDARELIPRLDAWYFRDARRLRRWSTMTFRQSVTMRHALRLVRRVFH